MDYGHLHRQLAITRKALFDQGYLDEQFHQLEELQDDASPNFVEEVVTLFFRDSSRLIENIHPALGRAPHDFGRLDNFMQQLKGSCSSIGASRVKIESSHFRDCCSEGNIDGCLKSFQKIKKEHGMLKQKLETYFQLQRQLGPAHGAVRRN